MSKVVDDFKAGKLDLQKLDWTALTEAEQNELLGLIMNTGSGTPVKAIPSKPTKSKGRGLGNTIKYVAIAGLVIGAGVAVYTLAF